MKKQWSLLLLIIALLLAGSLTQMVSANSVNVESGTTVTISEDSDGALAVSGQDIVVQGNINGALFAAGNSITIEGDVNGPVFIAGNSITIEGSIEGEVFIAGNVIRTSEETEFSRDAFIVGSEILINGTIGRDLFTGSDKIAINNNIGRNAHLYTNTIDFAEDGAVGGDMYYQARNEVSNIDQYVEGQVSYEEADSMRVQQERPQENILRKILNIVGALISALIIWWALRSIMQKRWPSISPRNLNRPIILMLIGLGFALLIPIIIILAFISSVLSGVGFFLLILFILLLFLARIITASVIGKYLLESRFNLNKYNALASFFVAYLLLYLAGMVPFIGWLISLLAAVYAIGLVVSEIIYRARTSPLQ